MENVKKLNTRLQLKYDTYERWTDETLGENVGANLVLLKGEIGICEIPSGNAEATTAPTVLFKVGDGTNPFKSLKWASALAADVYGWAKSETVILAEVTVDETTGEKKQYLQFKTGETVNHAIDLSMFATDADVNAVTTDLAARLSNIEAALGVEGGEGTDSVADQIADIVERLGVIQGADTVDGSIAKALKDAKAYTDEVIGTAAVGTEGTDGYVAATGIRKEIADAVAAETAARVAAETAQAAKDSEQDEALADEADAREAADKAITDVIGTGFEATETGTVAAKVKAAQDAADAAQDAADKAQADVNALTAEGGQVNVNAAAIAEIKTDLETEATTRENADKDLNERLTKVEAFFEGAAEDSEGLNDALDTLVEIQNLLSMEDGAAAGELLDAVTALQEVVGAPADGETAATGLVKDVAEAQEAIAALEPAVATLQDIVDGYTDKGSVKTAIEAAQTQADKGVEDAGKAQAAAEAAQKDVDDLAAIVGDADNGLVKLVNEVKTTAEDAQARVADAEGRLDDAEEAIENITGDEGLIATAKQEAIDAAATDASNKVAVALSEAQSHANNLNTAMDGRVTSLEADVAEIKGDYLKEADYFVFYCGDSCEITHVHESNTDAN